MPTPPFLPLSVTLMGHQNLGTVRGRWLDGGRLELDDGAIYGPGAVFSVRPVVELEPSRGALVWHRLGGTWGLCRPERDPPDGAVYSASGRDAAELAVSIAQITTWAREDGYTVPPWPGEESAPVVDPGPVPPVGRLRYEGQAVRWTAIPTGTDLLDPESREGPTKQLAAAYADGGWRTYRGHETDILATGIATTQAEARDAALRALLAAGVLTVEPEPVGTWGGHTDWIAWGGGQSPVPGDTRVSLHLRAGGGTDTRADMASWLHLGNGWDIIAYRIVQPASTPASKDRTVYDPKDIRPGDRHVFYDCYIRTVIGVAFGRVIYGAARGPGHHLRIADVNGEVRRVEPVDDDTGNF